jgi:hypothetical protein
MKEIITSVFIIIGLLWGGKMALKKAHDTVRTLALEKAAKGLPPLQPFARALAKPPKKKRLNSTKVLKGNIGRKATPKTARQNEKDETVLVKEI